MTAEQLAEAIKMATWFTTGHDDHLRSPAWNIANALLHEHKHAETAEADLRTKETQLAEADAVLAWAFDELEAGQHGIANAHMESDASVPANTEKYHIIKAAKNRHQSRQQAAKDKT